MARATNITNETKLSQFIAIFTKNAVTWIVVIGIILYSKTILFDFSYFDDNALIIDNIAFLQNIGNLPKAFLQDVFSLLYNSDAYYRPLFTISFMIDAIIAGTTPFMFHLTNVAIHISAVIAFYNLLRSMRLTLNQAFVGATIFLTHPLVSQTVAWIPGRNDSLLSVFVFCAMIYFVNYLNQPNPKSLFIHILFIALALLTKETALVLFPVLVCYAIAFRNTPSLKITLLKFATIWFALSLLWLTLRLFALTNPTQYTPTAIINSLSLGIPATIQIIGKMFLPLNLSVLPIAKDTTYLFGIATVVILTGLYFLIKQKNNRLALFGLIWLGLLLVPSFVHPNPNEINYLEHRAYLPLAGFIVFLLAINPSSIIKNTSIRVAFLFIIILALSCLTFLHLNNFRNRLTYWQSAVTTSPHSALAHRNYGVMLYFEGREDEAIMAYGKSLALNPDEPMAHNNLGVIFLKREMLTEAENHFVLELENNPNYDNATFNLGLAKYQQGNTSEAIALWEHTIKVNPRYAEAYFRLAEYYSNQNNQTELQRINQLIKERGIIFKTKPTS